MITCLIVVNVMTITTFSTVEFPTRNQGEAERFAAIKAGQIASSQHPDGVSRFGFECGDGEWVAVDLEKSDVFSSRKRRKAEAVADAEKTAQ